jgi:serine/threonine protein kinase
MFFQFSSPQLSGQFPFSGDSDEMYYKNVVEQELEFPPDEWQNVSQNAKDFIAGLLTKDPAKRLNIQEASNHKWLTDGTIKSQPGVEHSSSISEKFANLETPKAFGLVKQKKPSEILAKVESAKNPSDTKHQ